jgi:hypothetical protein
VALDRARQRRVVADPDRRGGVLVVVQAQAHTYGEQA